MTAKAKIILQPTTSATNSDEFQLKNDNTMLVATCTGLGAGETAQLQFYDVITTTWLPYSLNIGGVTEIPTFSNLGNKIEISDNLTTRFRFSKTATALPVGIYIEQWFN